MNFYLVTYAVSFVKVKSDNFKEEVTHVRFFDTDNFANAYSFLSSLKKVKKLRITGVEWELEECSWFDYYDDVSNTIN
jgi:thiamine pyrophosphokinase